MGSWGTKLFDNDSACDFALGLKDCSDLSLIKDAIDAVFREKSVDPDVSMEALGAIDTIARLKGQFSYKDGYTKDVDKWVKKHPIKPPKKLIKKAIKAIKEILGESSYLMNAANWKNREIFEAWKAEVMALKSRIEA